MDDKSREIMAFSTLAGHYEWLRLPMWLQNESHTFQRVVNTLFSGIICNGLFAYLDGLIVVSRDLDSHLQELSLVFHKHTQAGLKAKLTKCEFLKSRIEFLGHYCAEVPYSQICEECFFLGRTGCYRAFVKNFASIAPLLTRLLKKDVLLLWNDVQEHSFITLKDALTHTPILAFQDYKVHFTMCTDASALDIGTVLMFTEEGKRYHAFAYAVQVLISVEFKYSVIYLETLAVVWALQYFRDIIFSYPLTVYTDDIAVTIFFSW